MRGACSPSCRASSTRRPAVCNCILISYLTDFILSSAELSPLGRLNLTLLRRQFASPLASVRKILTDLMGVITQEPQPQQVRRFLKLQRDHGSLQWQLASVRRHIEAARTALERGTASDAASFQRTASVLQNIANDLKCALFKLLYISDARCAC